MCDVALVRVLTRLWFVSRDIIITFLCVCMFVCVLRDVHRVERRCCECVRLCTASENDANSPPSYHRILLQPAASLGFMAVAVARSQLSAVLPV